MKKGVRGTYGQKFVQVKSEEKKICERKGKFQAERLSSQYYLLQQRKATTRSKIKAITKITKTEKPRKKSKRNSFQFKHVAPKINQRAASVETTTK